MKTHIIGVAIALACGIATAASAQEPARQLPTGAQFLLSRIAEDSATIATLLDQLAKARAEAAELRAQVEKLKPPAAAEKPKE